MNDPEKKEPEGKATATDETTTEWPHNPPLPPRELDPEGEGDALRKVAAPGDDIVFEANAERPEPTKKKDLERSQPER